MIHGWNNKYLEGLTKHCKLNKTALVKFEQNGTGKVNLVLEKSKRWEVITDWMRKDAKLKIRVYN